MVILFVCLGAAVFLLSRLSVGNSAAMPQPSLSNNEKTVWDLVFYDEFDGNTLDTNKWVTCYWWAKDGCTNEGNRELQWYLPENASVSGGRLNLTAESKTVKGSNGKTYPYTSGMVTTGRIEGNSRDAARFPFQYGFVEVRAKIPSGKGLWPAIWMLPSDHISKPEIDVMEVLGHETNQVHMNFHYVGPYGEPERSESMWTNDQPLSYGWHTYAVHWEPDSIVWYIDGVERRRLDDASLIPHEPMYLLMNLAVGGNWPGEPDGETMFPSTFEIDYVRIWKKIGEITLQANADAYVNSDAPDQNYGEKTEITIDGSPQEVGYIKFDLPELSGRKIESAYLRIRNSGDGTQNSLAVYQVSNDWSENTITYNNRPPVNSFIIGVLDKSEQNITYEIPLEVSEIQKSAGKTLSLALVIKGYDGMVIYSREFRPFYPTLVLNTVASAGAQHQSTSTQPAQ